MWRRSREEVSGMRGQDDLLVHISGFPVLGTVPKLCKLEVWASLHNLYVNLYISGEVGDASVPARP